MKILKDYEYFSTTSGILYCGDSLEILPLITEKIDFVLTDPPYGTNDGKGKAIKRNTNEIVNFCNIEWDEKLDLRYIKYLFDIMNEDRWGVIFTDKMAITTLWQEIEGNKLFPRNTFYWYKTNKAPTPRSNFKSCVETAVVFTKGRTNQKWRGGANTENLIKLPFCSEGLHPTQKPVLLMQKLIELFTDKNDMIIDPFFGSGTTGVACEKFNRKWIAIEINEEYCKIAKKRIEQESNQVKLF